MQFSSRPPFNDDPMPWLDAGGWRSSTGHVGVKSYGPCPEFDRPQHNPTNPALTELRKNLAEGGPGNAKPIIGIRLKSLEWAMEEHETGWQRFTPETVAHIDHARRVLTRLSNLTH